MEEAMKEWLEKRSEQGRNKEEGGKAESEEGKREMVIWKEEERGGRGKQTTK